MAKKKKLSAADERLWKTLPDGDTLEFHLNVLLIFEAFQRLHRALPDADPAVLTRMALGKMRRPVIQPEELEAFFRGGATNDQIGDFLVNFRLWQHAAYSLAELGCRDQIAKMRQVVEGDDDFRRLRVGENLCKLLTLEERVTMAREMLAQGQAAAAEAMVSLDSACDPHNSDMVDILLELTLDPARERATNSLHFYVDPVHGDRIAAFFAAQRARLQHAGRILLRLPAPLVEPFESELRALLVAGGNDFHLADALERLGANGQMKATELEALLLPDSDFTGQGQVQSRALESMAALDLEAAVRGAVHVLQQQYTTEAFLPALDVLQRARAEQHRDVVQTALQSDNAEVATRAREVLVSFGDTVEVARPPNLRKKGVTQLEPVLDYARKSLLAPHADDLQRAARRSLRLRKSTKTTSTCLGGVPQLPSGAAWPHSSGGPLRFVGQIDFAEHDGAALGLPSHGLLSIFADDEEVFDATAEAWAILWTSDPKSLEEQAAPAGVKAFKRMGLQSAPEWSLPGRHWSRPLASRGASRVYEELLEACGQDVFDPSQHRLLGHAAWQQSPILEDDDEKTCLLLQIDSESSLGMEWGDGGRLFIFVERSELAAGDLSKAWLECQCT